MTGVQTCALPIFGRAKPIEEYLKAQGRFGHLRPEEIASIQEEVDARWKRLLNLEALG